MRESPDTESYDVVSHITTTTPDLEEYDDLDDDLSKKDSLMDSVEDTCTKVENLSHSDVHQKVGFFHFLYFIYVITTIVIIL